MKVRVGNLKHFAVIFIYIMVAVVFQFAILQIGDSYIYQYQHFITRGNGQDFKVVDINAMQVDRLELNFHEVFSEYQPISLKTSCIPINITTEEYLNASICSGNQDGLKTMKDLKIMEGSYPVRENQIVIEDKWNDRLSKPYSINDNLLINYSDGLAQKSIVLTISGIYKTVKAEEILTIWGTPELLKDFNESLVKNDFYFTSKKSYMNDAFLTQILDTYHYSMGDTNINGNDLSGEELSKEKELMSKFVLNDEKVDLLYNNDSTINFGNAMKYIGLFILIPMIISLIALKYLNAGLHLHEYRTLRSLGCSKKQLFLNIWKESLITAVPAVISGILIGTALNMIVGNYLINSLFILEIKFEIIYTWKTYTIAFILGLIPLIFSNALLMRKLKPEYPFQILIISKKKKHNKMKSYRDVLHFSRLSTTFLVVMFTILLFFYMIVINTLLVLPKAVIPLKEQLSEYEIMPNSENASLSQQQISELRELSGIQELYMAGNGITQMLNYQDSFIPHYIYDTKLMTVFSEKLGIKDEANDIIYVIPKVLDQDMVVFPLFDEEIYTFEINDFNGNMKEKTLTIDKVITTDIVELDGFGKINTHQPILVFSEKAANEMFGSASYTNVFVNFDTSMQDSQVRDFTSILKDDFGHYAYTSNSESNQIEAMMLLVGYITFIICLTVVLCFYCILSFIIMAKRKELGIMRAIGLSKKHMFTSMVMEVNYMLILSAILASLLFYPIYSYICLVLEMSGVQIQNITIARFMWTIVVGLLACMGILIPMLYHQTKQEIIMEIKER